MSSAISWMLLEMTSLLYFSTTSSIHPRQNDTINDMEGGDAFFLLRSVKLSNEALRHRDPPTAGERSPPSIRSSPETISDLRHPIRVQRSSPRQVNFQLHEELENGTIIGNLMHETQLHNTYSDDVIKQITFRFVAESVAFFHLDERTGMISVKSRIDRDSEKLCRQKATCEVQFSVAVQPLQYILMIKVVVEILDINDNPPIFKEPVFNLKINEAVLVSSFYSLPTAHDWDSPSNGIQRYAMNPEMRQFSLKVDSKFDPKGDEVSLVVMEKLDRETQADFRFQMLAYDSGPEPGVLEVIISVLDSNDNKPEFTRPYYEASIPEDLHVGTTFIRVNAVDLDLGLSGQVEYSLSPHSQAVHGHLFGINNLTGEVFLKNPVDRELSSIHQLVVVGRDRGPDAIGTETSLTIHIEDVNDNKPRIIINTLNGVDTTLATVVENAPQGTFVAHVRASDSDAKNNGEVSCSLVLREGPVYGSTTTPFVLIQKSFIGEYQIVTTAVLDREKQSSYSLLVQCKDAGMKPKTSETLLQVTVGDLNDNAPTFSVQMYKAFLVENNDIGTSILRVSASDLDSGENGRVSYTIPGNMAVTFHVDQTGIVSALDSVDREKYDTFKFPILAVDKGTPPKTGSALVVVIVEDVDDEKPTFLESNYTFSVYENLPQGTSVGAVSAVDKDGPAYSSFSYSLEASSKDHTTDLFYIDAFTGLISTRDVLDREKLGRHRLTVTAKDRKSAYMTGTVDVVVLVLDKQDNAPIIVYPHPGNETVHIPGELPTGSQVTRVIAHDLDATLEFNRLVHSIVIIGMHDSLEGMKYPQNVDNFLNFFHLNGSNDVSEAENFLGSDLKREVANLFSMDPDLGIITLTSSTDEYLDKIFQCLVIVRNPISRSDPTPSAVAANLYIVVNSSVALPDGFSDGLTSERSIFRFHGGAGLFRNLSDLLLYLIVAVVGGCVLVVLSVIFAVALLRRRERSRRLERMHKLNGGIILVDGVADLCKAGRQKIQSEESLPLSGETSREQSKVKTTPEQIPFCELNLKESIAADDLQPPWTVTLEKGTSSQCGLLHQVNKSYDHCNQLWRNRNHNSHREDCFSDEVHTEPSERQNVEQAKRLIPPPPPPTRGNFWKNQDLQPGSTPQATQTTQAIPAKISYSPSTTKTVSFSLLPSHCSSKVDYFTSTTSSFAHKCPPMYTPLSSQTLKNIQKIRPTHQTHNLSTLRPTSQKQQQQCYCGTHFNLTCDPSHVMTSRRSLAQFQKSSNKNNNNNNNKQQTPTNRPSTLHIDESHNPLRDHRPPVQRSEGGPQKRGRQLLVDDFQRRQTPNQAQPTSPNTEEDSELKLASTNKSFDV